MKVGTGQTPFLKWAGGKRWLAPQLKQAFNRSYRRYFEPFLGSGAVFFHNQPHNSHLSDANQELISCYQVVRDDPRSLVEELTSLSLLDIDQVYYSIRSERPDDPVRIAARFLYLNRTCWNGLYRVNQKGEFNVPRGTKTQILMPGEDFFAISACLQSTTIACCDFEQTINMAEADDIVFCDPPYTVAHNMNGFVKYNQNIFRWEDQMRLAAALDRAGKRGAIVVATNADHSDLRQLYADFGHMTSVPRSSIIAGTSAARRPTTELLILNEAAYNRLENTGL